MIKGFFWIKSKIYEILKILDLELILYGEYKNCITKSLIEALKLRC